MSGCITPSNPCNDPIWDCTDGACPAWWRGADQGVDRVLDIIDRALNHEFDRPPSFAYARINAVVKRIRALLGEEEYVSVHDGSVICL